jgi:hypothetical protein
MDNNQETNAVVENEVEETTQDSSPQSEVQETEQTPQEPVEKADVSSGDELPETEEERRRAFQEMRKELKALKEERSTREQSESAFDAFRQPAQIQQADVNQYVDPNTGQIDWASYNNAVTQTARQQASLEVKEQLDEHEARTKYPEVFSNKDLEEDVAAKYLYYKLRGQNVKVTDIAARVSQSFKKATVKAEKVGAERALTEVNEKEQAALSAQGQTSAPARQSQSSDDLERLRVMSRGQGQTSIDAIAQRLKGVPSR